jgi:hypothetical protein
MLHGVSFLHRRILELPLTTIQDYSLFNILGDYSIKRKTQIIFVAQRAREFQRHLTTSSKHALVMYQTC